jgi:hypothetical protein
MGYMFKPIEKEFQHQTWVFIQTINGFTTALHF